jgi:hypothetical protein
MAAAQRTCANAERQGARTLPAQAVEAEVTSFLESHADKLTADGDRRLVRHGHLPEHEILSGFAKAAARRRRSESPQTPHHRPESRRPPCPDEGWLGHCHGASALRSHWRFGSQGDEPGENACCVYIYRRQSRSGCNDRLFQLRDLKFMLARDAFMDFTCTFDAILQFRAQWRQKLRDREDSIPLQVCDYSLTEAYLLSN